MIKILNLQEIKAIKEELLFYDFNELESRNHLKIIINFQSEKKVFTYSDIKCNENFEQYIENEEKIFKCIKKYLQS